MMPPKPGKPKYIVKKLPVNPPIVIKMKRMAESQLKRLLIPDLFSVDSTKSSISLYKLMLMIEVFVMFSNFCLEVSQRNLKVFIVLAIPILYSCTIKNEKNIKY